MTLKRICYALPDSGVLLQELKGTIIIRIPGVTTLSDRISIRYLPAQK